MIGQEISISNVRSLIDEKLEDIISIRIEQAKTIHPSYTDFWQSILNTALAGGKRLRSYLAIVSYGEIDEDIVKVATAQEMLHIAMCIHDDVIDGDLVRHGQNNISGRYLAKYKNSTTDSLAINYANSAAILAGDALISEAYQLINDTNFSDDIKKQLNKQLGKSIFEVIGGELLDIESSFVTNQEVDPITVYRYKTASYSTVGPLLAGAYCGKRTNTELDALTDIAIDLGIAFQIQDDILGIFGDESKTGKTTIGDLREGKMTLLIKNHEANMDTLQQKRFENIFGNTEADIDSFTQIKQDIVDSKAKYETEKHIEFYFGKAQKEISELEDRELAKRLTYLIDILRSRKQ